MSFPVSFSVNMNIPYYYISSVYKLYLPDQTTHFMLNISVMENKLIKCLEIPCPPQRDHANNASKISENVQQTMLKTFFAILLKMTANVQHMELKNGIL